MDRENFVKENDKIAIALKKASGSFGKILCVIDNKQKLLGIITAGDIRRAILNGNDLNQSIKKIYNKNISYIFESELKNKKFSKSKFSNKELTQSIFYIPVVDEKKKVKNIFSTERIIELMQNKNLKQQKKRKLPKVLIVGGAGYIGSVLCKKLLKKKLLGQNC